MRQHHDSRKRIRRAERILAAPHFSLAIRKEKRNLAGSIGVLKGLSGLALPAALGALPNLKTGRPKEAKKRRARDVEEKATARIRPAGRAPSLPELAK
jgi:hypothetical protein